MKTAQRIHRNLVKIPENHFVQIEANPALGRYLRGKHSGGLVGDDGTISVNGLKDGVLLRWNNDLGLVVEKIVEEAD